jgi:hypothetical protein
VIGRPAQWISAVLANHFRDTARRGHRTEHALALVLKLPRDARSIARQGRCPVDRSLTGQHGLLLRLDVVEPQAIAAVAVRNEQETGAVRGDRRTAVYRLALRESLEIPRHLAGVRIDGQLPHVESFGVAREHDAARRRL